MNDALRVEIDTLIDSRAGKFNLHEQLAGLWAEFSWPSRRRAATDWLIGATLIDFGAIGVDYLINPSMVWLSILLRGACMPVLLLVMLQAWKRPGAVHEQGLTIVAYAISIMTIAGALGALAGGLTYERYIFSAVVGVTSALTVVPLRFIWTVLLAATICVAYLALQVLDNVTPFRGAVAIGIYLVAVCIALVMARRAKTVMQQRVVLMHFRDTFRVRDLAQANALLAHRASTDELTGLMNRRSLMEALHLHAAKSCRISLLMLDIDHFKRLNDSLGHSEGDRCLSLIGSTIKRCVCVQQACAARYGGEEFAILLPAINITQALVVAEAIRAAIESLGLPNPGLGKGRVVTVSVGVSMIETETIARESVVPLLMSQADDALYCAKRANRNRVCSYVSNPDPIRPLTN